MQKKKLENNKLLFKVFNPQVDKVIDIPNIGGNYLICLRKESKLPDVGIDYTTEKYEGLEVIYTGTSKNLRSRHKQNFIRDNAGISTLRKSVGSLFGYTKIPRDKDSSNNKTKFWLIDEKILSAWMTKNLLLYYDENECIDANKKILLSEYTPLLNSNKNSVNVEFSRNLSVLRK